MSFLRQAWRVPLGTHWRLPRNAHTAPLLLRLWRNVRHTSDDTVILVTRKRRKKCTSEQLDRLAELRQQGRSDEAIASELGRSVKAVQVQASRHLRNQSQPPPRVKGNWSREEANRLETLRQQNWQPLAVAKELGRSPGSVKSRWAEQRGLATEPDRKSMAFNRDQTSLGAEGNGLDGPQNSNVALQDCLFCKRQATRDRPSSLAESVVTRRSRTSIDTAQVWQYDTRYCSDIAPLYGVCKPNTVRRTT